MQFARRERWLASPAARAQRLASRMAFHGLHAEAAQRLLAADYGSVLANAGANPAPSVARVGRLVRYLGDYGALVRSPRGLRVVRSSMPLRTDGQQGGRAVDLGLRASGGSAFVPVAPAVGLSIARNSSAGVAVGGSGLRVTLEGADVSGTQVGGQSVFFPSVGADMDASVVARIDGAEFFAVLRSRSSPESIRYRVALPAGASLEERSGGADVLSAGAVLARFLPPSARDAQGTEVPVSMRVVGDQLTLTVAHRRRDVAYPILVDPTLTVSLGPESGGWTFTGSSGVGWSHSSMSIAASATLPVGGANSASAESVMPVPNSLRLTSVELLGMHGYTEALNEATEPYGSVGWRVWACRESYGGEWVGYGAPVPSKLVFEYPLAGACETTPSFGVALRLSGGPNPEHVSAHDRGEIGVGSMVVSFIPIPTELEEFESEYYGSGSAGAPGHPGCSKGHPVNCATGNQFESETDLSVGGRGPGLALTRTYNSRRAANQSAMAAGPGPFGYGWTGTDSAHLTFPAACFRDEGNGALCAQRGVDVYEDNGSSVFFEGASGGPYTAAPLVQATLVKEGSDYVYTLPTQTKLTFNETGQLLTRTDRNGNATTVKRNSEGYIESISDGAGRKLTYKYNSEHEVESIADPMGHTVKYAYEGGNLVSVTEPGESSPRWRFKYSPEHEMTEMLDGRGNAVTTEYEAGRVVMQKDALGRERKWKYATTEAGSETTITEPNGSSTVETFDTIDLPTSVTRASGTGSEAKTSYEYEKGTFNLLAVTDPNSHTTKYTYNGSGDRTSETNPLGKKTEWEYDSTHDVIAIKLADGEKTTIKRNANGEPETVSRPAPREATQTTTYKYDSHGDLESVEDPLKRVTKYEYDSYGDRSAEIDPEGDKRTWKYNEDSQLISMVSPRGNVKGAEASKFTTSIERDAQGRPTLVSEPEARGAAKPDDRTAASVSGMLWEGQTLTAGTGVWEGSPSLSYAYQWQHCNASGGECASISGATSSTRVLAKGEVGETIRVLVTATNSLGSTASTSPASAVVSAGSPPTGAPVNRTLPVVSGELLQGQTLSASTGTWSAGPNPTYAYQWQRCNRGGGECANISGATGSTRVLAKTEVAGSVRVVVTATNSGGHSAATSNASEVIEGARTTAYLYDANGNVEAITDPNGNKTKYTYDADNEPTKVEEPDGAVTETGYDKEGQVTSQTNGKKQVTEYVRNPLERVVETIDPLKRKTLDEYDKAGNLVKITDPLKRVTTNTYNEANQLVETSYSDGKTHAVKYEYNGDGYRTKMTDGTGETTYTLDQLDRLTETENGHKEKVGYEYDLDNEQTKITYPNGKAITRSFDKDGRLEKVTDWLEHATSFKYDPDSDLTSTVFPSSTGDEDSYVYNEADQSTEVKMAKGSETLASVAYTRDNEGNVKSASSKGLPGEESTSYEYDSNNRLVKAGGTAYEYDAANDPTKVGATAQAFSGADELEKSGTMSYSYDELGERTKATPEKGPVTGYGYSQAGALTSVERPEGESKPKIEDAYAYDGSKLRASQTISGVTSYFAWDVAEALPLLLSDGTNSYIYGPGGMPVEQVNNSTGTVLYLHHDQAGSTRLLTSSTGAKEASFTYGPYGSVTGSTGAATTPLGYDGQLTAGDTGMIYLRARIDDPATAQFVTVDPLLAATRAPYIYAGDNPLDNEDPTGLASQICVGGTVSVGLFSFGGELCYASTPGGSGIAATGSITVGPGFGASVHAGGGISNACRPSEYSGPFAQTGGSAEGLVGGYGNGFTNAPVPGHGRTIVGATGGVTAGLGIEGGAGGSETVVVPLGGESSGGSCSC